MKDAMIESRILTEIVRKRHLCDLETPKLLYSKNIISSKTFSLLVAEKIGLLAMPGFAALISNGAILQCFAINSESMSMNFQQNHKYLLRFDFFHRSEHLQSWLQERSVRPRAFMAEGRKLQEKLSSAIEKGKSYRKKFVLILQEYPQYSLVGQTVVNEDGVLLTEISKDPLISHGNSSIDSFLHKKLSLRKCSNRTSSDYSGILDEVAEITSKFLPLMGFNINIEWFTVNNRVYVSQVRPCYPNSFPCPYTDTKTEIGRKFQIISPGKCSGFLEIVPNSTEKRKTLTVRCSRDQEKYVFLANRPTSDLISLLPFSAGFIFKEGSLLCHFSILLREAGIPSIIVKNAETDLPFGKKVAFNAEGNNIQFTSSGIRRCAQELSFGRYTN